MDSVLWNTRINVGLIYVSRNVYIHSHMASRSLSGSYSVFSYSEDFLCGVHFYTGALLAELSLVVGNSSYRTSTSRRIRHCGLLRIVKNYWAIILAIFALVLGSYPDSGEEQAAWSRFLFQLGWLIFPSNCILLLPILWQIRDNFPCFLVSLYRLSRILNPLLTYPPPHLILSLPHVPRKHFVPYVSPSVNSDENSTRMASCPDIRGRSYENHRI